MATLVKVHHSFHLAQWLQLLHQLILHIDGRSRRRQLNGQVHHRVLGSILASCAVVLGLVRQHLEAGNAGAHHLPPGQLGVVVQVLAGRVGGADFRFGRLGYSHGDQVVLDFCAFQWWKGTKNGLLEKEATEKD